MKDIKPKLSLPLDANDVHPKYEISTRGMQYTATYDLKNGQKGEVWFNDSDTWIVFALTASLFGKYMKGMF